ncbi:hypothetical protein G134_1799 [Lactobacillus delbrueckii subsp. lactis CRL581]|nr:hypothetical protein G134_1799 [Lactobacillus delbrueckii subsp. lactis CRL581]
MLTSCQQFFDVYFCLHLSFVKKALCVLLEDIYYFTSIFCFRQSLFSIFF